MAAKRRRQQSMTEANKFQQVLQERYFYVTVREEI
jgi:hypothetical protein